MEFQLVDQRSDTASDSVTPKGPSSGAGHAYIANHDDDLPSQDDGLGRSPASMPSEQEDAIPEKRPSPRYSRTILGRSRLLAAVVWLVLMAAFGAMIYFYVFAPSDHYRPLALEEGSGSAFEPAASTIAPPPTTASPESPPEQLGARGNNGLAGERALRSPGGGVIERLPAEDHPSNNR